MPLALLSEKKYNDKMICNCQLSGCLDNGVNMLHHSIVIVIDSET